MAITWTRVDDWSVKGVCASGSEVIADVLASDGLDLSRGTSGTGGAVGSYEVHVEPTSASDTLTAGTAIIYVYNKASGHWNQLLDGGVGLSFEIPAGLDAGAGVNFPGDIANTPMGGRIIVLPSGLGVPVTVYILGSRKAA